jgi:hypothetical protein
VINIESCTSPAPVLPPAGFFVSLAYFSPDHIAEPIRAQVLLEKYSSTLAKNPSEGSGPGRQKSERVSKSKLGIKVGDSVADPETPSRVVRLMTLP